MLQKLYCLMGLLVLVTLAGCKTATYDAVAAESDIVKRLRTIEHLYQLSLRELRPDEPYIMISCTTKSLDYIPYRWIIKEQENRTFLDYVERNFSDRPIKKGTVYTVKRRTVEKLAPITCEVNSVHNYLSPSEKKAQAQLQQQQQQQAMQGRSNTCKGFGFKENTEAHAQCMFDLFKLEQQASAQQLAIQSQAAQNQAIQSQMSSDAATQRALLQQQIDQQNFNQGIQLLQQSQQLLNPPRPTTTCKWNEFTNTMVCR